MGATFTSPLFTAILTGELSPTQNRSYLAAFIPDLFAATLGYVIYYTGSYDALGELILSVQSIHSVHCVRTSSR